jgi:hypothetical protein
MNKVVLRMAYAAGQSLLRHLYGAPEQVAFMRGSQVEGPDVFELTELLRLSSEDLDRRWTHVSMSDRTRRTVLGWATRSGDILVEAHSHGGFGDPAVFSRLDLEGLADWVPHVRWRLQGRPYGALVFGQTSMDGLAWIDDRVAIPIGRLEVKGSTTFTATGRSYRRYVKGHDGRT